jgi:hypothetical protein
MTAALFLYLAYRIYRLLNNVHYSELQMINRYIQYLVSTFGLIYFSSKFVFTKLSCLAVLILIRTDKFSLTWVTLNGHLKVSANFLILLRELCCFISTQESTLDGMGVTLKIKYSVESSIDLSLFSLVIFLA